MDALCLLKVADMGSIVWWNSGENGLITGLIPRNLRLPGTFPLASIAYIFSFNDIPKRVEQVMPAGT